MAQARRVRLGQRWLIARRGMSRNLLALVKSYQPSADSERIRRAYLFAEKAHSGQFRRSGEPYVTHPLSVSHVIGELKLDADSICAGLLHDCVKTPARRWKTSRSCSVPRWRFSSTV